MIRTANKAMTRHTENSKRVAIVFQVPSDPLPAVLWDERVSVGALKRSDQDGTSGEVRRSTELKKQQQQLKSVRVHFAYGRIALTLELLGRFGRFLDEDDRCNPPVLLIPFLRLLGL